VEGAEFKYIKTNAKVNNLRVLQKKNNNNDEIKIFLKACARHAKLSHPGCGTRKPHNTAVGASNKRFAIAVIIHPQNGSCC